MFQKKITLCLHGLWMLVSCLWRKSVKSRKKVLSPKSASESIWWIFNNQFSRIYLANFSQKFRCFSKSRRTDGNIEVFRDREGRCGRYCLLLEIFFAKRKPKRRKPFNHANFGHSTVSKTLCVLTRILIQLNISVNLAYAS